MEGKLTIGEVSRRTGVPVRSIRFYEAEGIVPAAVRTESGYRSYQPTDLRRFRLVKRARLLGLSLPEVKALVGQAFASECSDFAEAIVERIAAQRQEIRRRIAELEALESELDELTGHVYHSQEQLQPGQRVADCSFCPLIDDGDEEEGRVKGYGMESR